MLVLLVGCGPQFEWSAQSGREFNPAAADRIEVGKTTAADVLAWLGEPLKKAVNHDGTKVYDYSYGQNKVVVNRYAMGGYAMDKTSTGDRLLIYFDKKGVVSKLERTTMPAAPASQK
jgi:outer membrane protein assembly factor BamE (lipoprotein component of BamABCDE complex)